MMVLEVVVTAVAVWTGWWWLWGLVVGDIGGGEMAHSLCRKIVFLGPHK